MATIPTYQREQIKAPTNIAKQGGAPGQAAARGYSNIAAAQGRLSNQLAQKVGTEQSAVAMEMNSLSNRLREFNQYIDNTVKSVAINMAQRQGVKDVATRRKEIIDIKQRYANDPAKMDEEIEKVNTATMIDDFSVYGQVYSNTVDAAFANQSEMDARNFAIEAEYLANGNPEKFKELYNSYTKEVIKDAPTAMGAIATEKAFEKHHTSVYRGMYEGLQAQASKAYKENSKGAINSLGKFIDDFAQKGDTVRVKKLQGQLAALTQSQVDQGLMDPIEAAWINQEAFTIAQTQEFMRYGNQQVAAGRGWRFITELKNPDTIAGQQFDKLPTTTQEKVLQQMEKSTRAFQDAELGKEKHNNEKVSVFQESNMRAYMEQQLKGKRFSPTEIRDMVQSGDLDSAQGKDLLASQDIESDSRTLQAYNNKDFLVSIESEQIENEPNLSLEDKTKILDKRTQALKDPIYDWTKSRVGQEAIKRLKEDYDIPDSQIQVIMSKVKGERTAKEQEYIELRRQMFDEIQDMPYQDQPEGAMKVYNKVKAQRVEQNKVKEDQVQLERDEAAWKKYSDRATKESEGWFSSEVSVDDMIKEDVDAGKITPGYGRKLQRTFGSKQGEKPQKPKQVPTNLHTYQQPKVKAPDPIATIVKADDFGYSPMITGKNVDMSGLDPVMTKAAYPILEKYNLGIRDAFRSTPGRGAKNSQHLHGNAFDVDWGSRSDREKAAIIQDFKRQGFTGFGVGNNTLHVDMRKAPASWSYIGGTPTGGGKMPAWAAQAIKG